MAYIGAPSVLGDARQEEEQFRKAWSALKAALDLSPRGGYVKGSRAREALKKALDSIPDSLAGKMIMHLSDSQGPLARLFRYRLAQETQAAVLGFLLRKAQRDKRRLELKLQRQQKALQAEQRLQQQTQQLRNKEREICRMVSELCQKTGESSPSCITLRTAHRCRK